MRVISQSKIHEIQGTKFTRRVIEHKGQSIIILIDCGYSKTTKFKREIKDCLSNISVMSKTMVGSSDEELVLYRNQEHEWGGWYKNSNRSKRFDLGLIKQPSWPTPDLLNRLILKYSLRAI